MSVTPPPGWQPDSNDPTRAWLTAPPPQPRRSDKPVGWGLIIFGVLALLAMNNPNTRTTGGGPGYAIGHIIAELLFGVWPIVGGIRVLGHHNRQMAKWRKAEIAAEDARAAQFAGRQPYMGQQPYMQQQPYAGQQAPAQSYGAHQFQPAPPTGQAYPYPQPNAGAAATPARPYPGTPGQQSATDDERPNPSQA